MYSVLVRCGRLLLPLGVVPPLVLGLVLAAVWLTLQVLQPTTLPTLYSALFPPASTDRTAAPAGIQVISLADAVAGVKAFTKVPDLRLSGALQTGRFGDRQYAVYVLESADGQDFFKVDARTGEVLEATLRSKLSAPALPWPLDQDQAEAVAGSYVRERFAGFEDLVLVSRSLSRAGNGGILFAFKWAAVARDSGAELPISVFVSVSAGNGQVVWYLAQRDPVEVDTRPTLTAQEAMERAAVYLAEDPRWDISRATSTRLMVVYDESNHQRLVWSVTFASSPDASGGVARPSLRLLVDAHTGDLLQQPFQQPKG